MKALPPIGSRVRIKGDHPWHGNAGEVITHELIWNRIAAKVRISRQDAMDGHECFAEARHLELDPKGGAA